MVLAQRQRALVSRSRGWGLLNPAAPDHIVGPDEDSLRVVLRELPGCFRFAALECLGQDSGEPRPVLRIHTRAIQ